jgi:hypothetical protein
MFGKRSNHFAAILVLLISTTTFGGNPEISEQNLTWFRFIGSGKISNNLTWKTELENRTLVPWQSFQFLSRTHVLYNNGKDPQLGLGLTFTRFSREDPSDTLTLLHYWEMRVQSEISWKQKANNRVQFGQRIWIEERLRPDDFGVFRHDNLTLRFQADMKVNIWKKGEHAVDAGIFDEIFFQTLKPSRFSAFNHNRMGANISYTYARKYTLETGYFYWYQLGSSQQSLILRHIFRTTLKVRI